MTPEDDATGDVGENMPQSEPVEPGELPDAWVLVAWKLWINGLRNWSAIAQEVGHDRKTVKRNVIRHGETIAELYTSRRPSVLGEYIDGLVADLAFNMQIAIQAARDEPPSSEHPAGFTPDYHVAVRARREVSHRRRDIAEVLGLVGPLSGGGATNILIGVQSGGGSNGEAGLSPQAIQFMLARESLVEEEFLGLPPGEPPVIDGDSTADPDEQV